MKAYIIKCREQPSQLYAKHVWRAKRMVKVRCMHKTIMNMNGDGLKIKLKLD
jgi:hypothetical protein